MYGSQLSPEWPTSSPYVTSVGSTTFAIVNGSTVEKSTSWSGSGFSTLYKRPSYQNDVVENYLKQEGLPPKNMFNQQGRAYPGK